MTLHEIGRRSVGTGVGVAGLLTVAILTVFAGCAQEHSRAEVAQRQQTEAKLAAQLAADHRPGEIAATGTISAASTASTAGATNALSAHETSGELTRHEYRQIVMAVEARIVLYAPSDEVAQRAAGAAFVRLNEIDAICSDYRPDSEVMHLCAAGGGDGVPVSEDLWAVLTLARELSAASGGAFDVTCGTHVALWRRARSTRTLPTSGEMATAMQLSGAPSLVLDEARHTAALAAPGIRLDLGGIAKGYALGAAQAALQANGVTSAMVAMGGDVSLSAPPPGAPGWRLRIGGPDDETLADAFAETLVLSHCAVATSGDANQFVEIGGVRYGHIVDPRTGWALTNRFEIHVVLPESDPPDQARTAARADALATAGCVLGEVRGRQLAESFGATEVRFTRGQPISLFDGRSLDGWTTRGGRYDGDAVWTVADGCIVGRTGPGNAGGLLYTQAPHSSFELTLDCKLDHPFDSGLFVRMTPDARGAQFTLDDRPDGEIAGLYSDGWIQHATPEAAASWRRNEWNHVVLRCTGFDMHLQGWVNGVAVLDGRVPQEFGSDGRPVFAPHGLIGLQVHGGGGEAPDARARFRNLTLRDLPVLGDESVTPGAPGWDDLADTQAALADWEAVDGEGLPRAPDEYRVTDGVLAIPSSQPSGYLRTKADFSDMELRMDFRQARMSNSGLFLRGRREAPGPDGTLQPGGNPAYSGCELQLLDDHHWEAETHTTLAPYQFTASLYGAVPAGREVLRPIGEWNAMEVLYRGTRLAVALNGLILYDVDTAALTVDPPFSRRAPGGFLGLQRYAAPEVSGDTALRVRGLRVKRL